MRGVVGYTGRARVAGDVEVHPHKDRLAGYVYVANGPFAYR